MVRNNLDSGVFVSGEIELTLRGGTVTRNGGHGVSADDGATVVVAKDKPQTVCKDTVCKDNVSHDWRTWVEGTKIVGITLHKKRTILKTIALWRRLRRWRRARAVRERDAPRAGRRADRLDHLL